MNKEKIEVEETLSFPYEGRIVVDLPFFKQLQKEHEALEIIKRIKFDIVYQEQFDEWTLFVVYETEDGSQLVPVAFGSGKEQYDLLKEVLL